MISNSHVPFIKLPSSMSNSVLGYPRNWIISLLGIPVIHGTKKKKKIKLWKESSSHFFNHPYMHTPCLNKLIHPYFLNYWLYEDNSQIHTFRWDISELQVRLAICSPYSSSCKYFIYFNPRMMEIQSDVIFLHISCLCTGPHHTFIYNLETRIHSDTNHACLVTNLPPAAAVAMAAPAKWLQSCPTLCSPVDWILPRSSVHGMLQAR